MMMKILFSLTGAAFALSSLPAQAEDTLPVNAPAASYEVCHLDADGGSCSHFQGYVYVRRAPAVRPSAETKAASDSSLGGARLYLRVDGGEMR